MAKPGQQFVLKRHTDPTGVSGTGRVAHGIRWPDGTCCVRWLGKRPTTTVYSCLDDVRAIHSHDGATELIWED